MAKRKYHSGTDYGMINGNNKEHANMPKEVIIKDYPKEDTFGQEGYGDSLNSIDSEIKANKPKK